MLALIPWFELRAWHVVVPGLEFTIPIQPFGVLAAIAIVVGSKVAQWRARSVGVSVESLRRFLAFTIPLGLLSCMLLNVLFYEPAKFLQMGRSLASWFGPGPSVAFPYPGLSSFGGFFGGTLTGSCCSTGPWRRSTRLAGSRFPRRIFTRTTDSRWS
jgi:prolipoprotein diacylglyceryltransferase